MRNFLKRIFLYDTEPLELWLDIAMGLWGFWLLLPYDTFSTSHSYDGIAYFMSEPAFGALMLIVSLAQFWSIAKENYLVRRYALLAHATIALFIVLAVAAVNFASTGIAAFIAFATGAMFCYIKVSSDL